jgi:hypothetical protein
MKVGGREVPSFFYFHTDPLGKTRKPYICENLNHKNEILERGEGL